MVLPVPFYHFGYLCCSAQPAIQQKQYAKEEERISERGPPFLRTPSGHPIVQKPERQDQKEYSKKHIHTIYPFLSAFL
jgi:hypothetical protein